VSVGLLTNQKLRDARLLLNLVIRDDRPIKFYSDKFNRLLIEKDPNAFQPLWLDLIVTQLFFAYQSLLRELIEPFKLSHLHEHDRAVAVLISAQSLVERLEEQALVSPELNMIAHLERGEGSDSSLAVQGQGDWLKSLIAQFRNANLSILDVCSSPGRFESKKQVENRITMVPVEDCAGEQVDFACGVAMMRLWYQNLKELVMLCRERAQEW